MNKLDHLSIINKLSKYADFSEVYEETVLLWTVENDMGKIEKCAKTSEWGCSLRSFKDNDIFFTASNMENERALTERHIKIQGGDSKNTSSDFCYERKVLLDFDFSKTLEDYIKQTKDTLKKIQASVKELLNAKITFQRYDKVYIVTNSFGNFTQSSIKGERFAIHLTVGIRGDKFTVYESVGYTFKEVTEEEIEKLVNTIIKRVESLKIAKDGPAGIYPCILSSEAGGTLIHEAVGHGLEADLVDKGVSIYKHKLEEKVASDLITVVDDGTYENGYGSFLVDDEGTPSQRTVLIENGVLKSYLYDIFFALKHNTKSTGNGRRESYLFKPYPRMTNTFILPRNDEVDDLVRSIDNGVFVKKIGGGQVNTITGDFIFEILEGYWIEKGEISFPLKNLSIMGNGPAILQEVDGVGSDFGTAIGTCGKEGQGVPVGDGQPTIRIPKLTIGGKL